MQKESEISPTSEDVSSHGDFECPVCISIISRPVLTPCNHIFCITCIEKTLENDEKCPMCRGELADFEPIIDEEVRSAIKIQHPKEFAEKEKWHEEDDLLKGRMIKKKISYGNLHHVEEPSESSGMHNSHHWAAFVKFPHDLPAKKFVKKVRFLLHPTFPYREVDVVKEPFVVRRIGWGYFTIPITIHWQDWLKMEPTQFNHTLCFDGEGKTLNKIVEIDKELLDKAKSEVKA
jgi:hypothetical protein